MKRFLLCAILCLWAGSGHAAVFGVTSAETGNLGYKNTIRLNPVAVAPTSSGLGDSITCFVRSNLGDTRFKFALYTLSGSDTVLVTNGVTAQGTQATTSTKVWVGLAFPSRPTITSGQQYFLAPLGDADPIGDLGTPQVGFAGTGGTSIFNMTNVYDVGHTTPFLSTSAPQVDDKMSCYCTYTVVAGIKPRRREEIMRPGHGFVWEAKKTFAGWENDEIAK